MQSVKCLCTVPFDFVFFNNENHSVRSSVLKALTGLSHALPSKDNGVQCRYPILQNLSCLYLGGHMCLFSQEYLQMNGHTQLFYNYSNGIEIPLDFFLSSMVTYILIKFYFKYCYSFSLLCSSQYYIDLGLKIFLVNI